MNEQVNKEEFIQMLHKAEIQKEILRIVKDGQSGIFCAADIDMSFKRLSTVNSVYLHFYPLPVLPGSLE